MPSCNWAFGCAIGLFVITLIIVLIILLGGSDENKEKIVIMPPSPAPTPSPPGPSPPGPSPPGPAPAALGAPSGKASRAAASKIMELQSAQEASRLLKGSKPAIVMFYANFCGHCKKMMPDFEQAAREASSKSGVIIAKVESGNLKDMASVSAELPLISGFPTMCTNYEGGGIQSHVGRKDMAAIVELLNKASGAVRKAASTRAARAAGKKKMVEYGSLQEACAALKGKEKAIVMAYADWCGFCKAMKADYESLVDKAPAGVTVGRLNSNAMKPGEVCEGVEEIKAYPTILYNNGSKITKVMGKQSLQALMELLKK